MDNAKTVSPEFPHRALVETIDAGPIYVTVYAESADEKHGRMLTIKRDDRKRKLTLPARFVRALSEMR
jgi:hypothetical protein